jgi:nucleotide-binding universal stress UspA family protein
MTAATHTDVFDRVVCGVDGTDEGLLAARAAAVVTDPGGKLTLVSVNDPEAAVHAGWDASRILERIAAEAEAALEHGIDVAEPMHAVDGKLVKGAPLRALLDEIERQDATAVVVGSHGYSRPVAITLGSVGSYVLHDAPCTVLVARGRVEPESWPRRIVVGVDGSPHSARAHEAARALAARTGAALRAMVATQDSHLDLEAARRIAPDLEEHDARAIDCLYVASESADLVVVGSRGLRGVRALGSLSERVAHEAHCSVLVVRGR